MRIKRNESAQITRTCGLVTTETPRNGNTVTVLNGTITAWSFDAARFSAELASYSRSVLKQRRLLLGEDDTGSYDSSSSGHVPPVRDQGCNNATPIAVLEDLHRSRKRESSKRGSTAWVLI